MEEFKQMKRKGVFRKGLSVLLSLAMVLSVSSSFAFAADSSWSFTEPEAALSTAGTGGARNIKMNAFRASIPVAALLGGDLVAGGNITWQTEDSEGNRIGLNLIGSDVNTNPDTYVWNFNYVSKFFSYANRTRIFQWLKKDGSEASNAEVWDVLPQSEFMYPILTYDSNTHNMYASWGGNDTDTAALAELGGVSKTMYMRPDLVLGNDGTSYADQVKAINSFKKGDAYYQDGDESYDPTFIELGCGTMEQKTDGVKIVAETMNQMIAESNGALTTRYGDPYTIAADYEKAVFGIYYYVMSNLKEYGGTIDKKDAALCTAYDSDTGTYTVQTTFDPMYQLLGTHTTNKIAGKVVSAEGTAAGEAMTYKLTAEDMSVFDFIYASSSSVKTQLMNDFEKMGLKEDTVPDVEERITLGVCNPATPWACNVITQEFPVTQLYIYKDELAEINPYANPMAMIAYEAENWYHIKNTGSILENVVSKMVSSYWNPVNDLDNVPDKEKYQYNKEEIDKMIEQGIVFAKEHASDQSTWMDGSYNINDPIYKSIKGTEEYSSDRVTLTDELVNNYKKKMETHPWQPDLSVGIGKDLDIDDPGRNYAQEAADKFTDVTASYWAAEYIGKAVAQNLFLGTTDTTFSPEDEMTRAMLITVLYRMAGSPEVNGNAAFTDVDQSKYYAAPVKWGVDNGITNGTSETTFDPSASVTREQVARLIYNYNKYKNNDVSASASLSKFTDAGSVSEWAVKEMRWAVATGMINGMTETTLVPQGTATRAQVATMLTR